MERTKCRIVLGFLFIVILQGCNSQDPESNCGRYKTCSECIQSKDRCAWCQNPDSAMGNQSKTRCNSQLFYNSYPESCGKSLLVDKINEMELLKDVKITNTSSSDPQVIQIRPQRVSLKLRVGQPLELKVEFAQARDYPVDLYYLMDLSYSMKDDKENLNLFGEQLAMKMRELTSNFRMGFGSFVDKVAMPFVSTVEKKLQSPCGEKDVTCVPPYSFQNHLSLTNESSRFTEEVSNSKPSGNLDSPEGGFDGIVQVAVCDDSIGWREEARKFIVFATDASFHFAGDGKLAGIIKPNDLKCHLNSNGYYTHAEILDYPSIAQINSLAKRKVINIIFAVTYDQLKIYNILKDSIEGSAVGELTSDSSNVVQLVTNEYQKITSTIEMKSTASDDMSVTFYTNCNGSSQVSNDKKNRCTNIPIGTKIEFTTKIEALSCPPKREDWKKQFEIYSVGVGERIVVDLEIICGCEECENQATPKAEECNEVGTLVCGVCKCDNPYFGENCQCDDKSGPKGDEEWRCRKDNSTDICSKKGQCYCGQCECNRRENPKEKIYGEFCECDNFSCERENGVLCSGEDHGSCECGKCECENGWSGPACACKTDESTCYRPGDEEKCSGRGKCRCGQCECQQTQRTETSETYSGRFCEICRNCPDECDKVAECVQCQIHKTGNVSRCPDICFRYKSVEAVEYVSDNGTSSEKFCLATDESDGCRFYFLYGYTENREIYVKAQQAKDCPPEAPVALIIGGGTFSIVLVGLLSLILWKIFTTIHDRREYAQFEKDKDMAKFSAQQNPIYKEAVTTFQNPGYAGNK